jgi:hypothetical protein
VHNSVSILEHLPSHLLLSIDGNAAIIDSFSIVLLRVGLELRRVNFNQGLSNPSAFTEGNKFVIIRLNETQPISKLVRAGS